MELNRVLQLAGLLTESQLDDATHWASLLLLDEGKKEDNIAASNKGPVLLAAWNDDPGSKALSNITTAQQVVEYISAHTNPKYINWVADRYLKKELKIADFAELSEKLKWFSGGSSNQVLAAKGFPNAIEKYPTFAEFKRDVYPLVGVKTLAELENEQEKAIYAAKNDIKDIIKASNPEDFHAFQVLNKYSAMLYGGNPMEKLGFRLSQWCTGKRGFDKDTLKELTMWPTYEHKGAIYIIFTKLNGEKRRFQLLMEDNQFNDETNSAIKKEDIAELSKIPEYTEFLNWLIKKYYHVPEAK